MAESSAIPALPGLALETVEWLPSGTDSGLVRVRGRWSEEAAAREDELPVLVLRAAGGEHRFESLPDARFSRDPDCWRGTYLVAADVVATDPEAMWVEWPSGARAGLPPLSRGPEPPRVPAAPERPEEPDEPGGQVIDHAVLAERRARRAEAAEEAAARAAADARKAVEVLELRSAELERRLEEATAERDALAGRDTDAARGDALTAALAAAAEVRARAREWQLRLRTSEIVHAGDAVRLAVLESERRAADAAAEARISGLAADLGAARQEAAGLRDEIEGERAAAQERVEAAEARAQGESVARATLEDELDRARAAAAEAAELRGRLEHAQGATGDLHERLQEGQAERAALRDQLEALAAEVARLRHEGDAARADGERLRQERDAARGEADRLREEAAGFRADLEREREQAAQTLEARIAEVEQRARASDLERLAREQAEAASAREPSDAGGLVADLDAAAEALRRRVPEPEPADERAEPAAPDAEPASEWDAKDEPRRDPVAPGVEPVRAADADAQGSRAWQPPGVEPEAHEDEEDGEPPAPDAEPAVEWAMPGRGPDAPAPFAAAPAVEPVPEPAPAAEAVPATPAPEPAPAGPRIVPASKPPARGLMLGSSRREYPLLRGALVKLAHDDPALAGRVLAALLPAQGLAVQGPLSYDVSIGGTGTYSVSVTSGRTFVRAIEEPRSRGDAEFHLQAAPLVLAELLAGVDHRIGRFFGPARIRGRKRHAKALKTLPSCTVALAEAARAGAQLEPELVYRTLAYAVHPSWTRGHRFTIAQAIEGDRFETWYLTAEDGAGLSVAPTARGHTPDATVSMSRTVFDRLLRGEPIQTGERPVVRGNREAVAHMTAWTRRVQS
ncbi:MAG TPA: hypothetical protein VFP78_09875 [Solirubrobacteraceae bacterium]|nr:hypothetical protein [Solirubrobacteraceae bacterium]